MQAKTAPAGERHLSLTDPTGPSTKALDHVHARDCAACPVPAEGGKNTRGSRKAMTAL